MGISPLAVVSLWLLWPLTVAYEFMNYYTLLESNFFVCKRKHSTKLIRSIKPCSLRVPDSDGGIFQFIDKWAMSNRLYIHTEHQMQMEIILRMRMENGKDKWMEMHLLYDFNFCTYFVYTFGLDGRLPMRSHMRKPPRDESHKNSTIHIVHWPVDEAYLGIHLIQ